MKVRSGRRGRLRWLAVGIATVVVGLLLVRGASLRAGSRPRVPPAGRAGVASPGQARAEPAPRPRHPATPATSSASSAPTPLERLAQVEETPEEKALLWDAVQARVAACMEQRGFAYDRLPYDDNVDKEGDRLRFHPEDVEAARQWGYGLARGIEDSVRREQTAAQRPHRSMSAAYREALAGPPPRLGAPPGEGWGTTTTPDGAKLNWFRDSCLSHARDDVYGADFATLELGVMISRLRKEVAAALAVDDEARAGLARWAACMTAHGYAYREPGEAMTALAGELHAGRLSLDELRTREREIAVTDTTCYQGAGLSEVLAAARARAERAVLARAAGAGEQLRAPLDNALARADRVLDADAAR